MGLVITINKGREIYLEKEGKEIAVIRIGNGCKTKQVRVHLECERDVKLGHRKTKETLEYESRKIEQGNETEIL